MRLNAAILCDAATVREGLLHLLGGGITRIWRAEIPTVFAVDLAVVLGMTQVEQDQSHDVRIALHDPDMGLVVEMAGTVAYGGGARLEAGEEHSIPMVFPLRDAVAARYGRYVIDIGIDGESHRRIDVWLLHPEEQVLPPIDLA